MAMDPLLRAGPLAFVDDLDRPVLDESDRHHLGRVVRLRHGDALVVSDGRGAWRPCRFGSSLEVTGEPRRVDPPPVELCVAFTPVKGERSEWTVQKLTEIGVDSIVLLEAERSVVRLRADRADRQIDRLRKVGREAAMQSRRLELPSITGPVDVGSVAARDGAAILDPDGGPSVPLGRSVRTVMVGPEGGWTDGERRMAPAVSIGASVLRAETAALVAGTLMVAGRGAERSR
jgi:16S rRNA (uracil1498-N3)-methyltransferase